MIIKAILAIGVLILSTSSFAESRYVSDTQYVPMRSGPGNEYRITNSRLKTGLKLKFLETEQSGDWTKISTPGGTVGWIRSQYLQKSPTSKMKLAETHNKWLHSTKRVEQLESNLKQLNTDHSSLTSNSNKKNNEHSVLSEKYKKLKTLSANAVNLSHNYEELLTKHEMFKTEFDTIKAENDRLKSEKSINQWLFGAGLIILGMILMLVLPALKPQKGNSDWTN